MRKSLWLWILLLVLAVLVLGMIFGGYRMGTKLGAPDGDQPSTSIAFGSFGGL
ncbi:hypothetical protein [Amycolatopsis sp. WQ 127309]|uniref:hypothetical protein n=1 Tax=Amycolatopsis sp. WQ 127309 TaxID=2932773 RepID=UPI001FF60367|nr:hypothetical protein [Amycolatopsis sp. WQ 127309]UOZ05362.1 hypothetical protein MUY22_42105 [Amycolatopsis sp. WQ 127309]